MDPTSTPHPHRPPSDLKAHRARTVFLLTPTPPPPQYEDDPIHPLDLEPESNSTAEAFLNMIGYELPTIPEQLVARSAMLQRHYTSNASRYAIVRNSLT